VSKNPAALVDLRTFLKSMTGLPNKSLGIVGDTAHDDGYHLGKDRIFGPGGKGNEDYSVRTTRDKNALTNSASAIDIGGFKRLRELSKWLVAQGQANAPDTRDIREIIYSPDGKKVFRWDRQQGAASAAVERTPDSHRFHTHVSFYRDSEADDKTALFKRFFDGGTAAAIEPKVNQSLLKPKSLMGDIVKKFNVPKAASICTVPKGARLFTGSDLGTVAFVIDPGRDMPFIGEPFPGIALVHRTTEQGDPTGVAFFARKADLKKIRPVGTA